MQGKKMTLFHCNCLEPILEVACPFLQSSPRTELSAAKDSTF